MAAASESTSQQLQTIQACVLSALEHAAATLDVLAAADGVPKAELAQTCNAFLEQIKTAQVCTRIAYTQSPANRATLRALFAIVP